MRPRIVGAEHHGVLVVHLQIPIHGRPHDVIVSEILPPDAPSREGAV